MAAQKQIKSVYQHAAGAAAHTTGVHVPELEHSARRTQAENKRTLVCSSSVWVVATPQPPAPINSTGVPVAGLWQPVPLLSDVLSRTH